MTRLPWSASVLHDGGQLGIEELPLVDADDLGVGLHLLEQLARRCDVLRGDLHLAVRDDVVSL